MTEKQESERVEAPGKEKNWISVTIIYGNQSKSFDFNIHFTIRRVLEEAIKAFGQQPPVENYQLFYNDQQLSELNRSLQDYDIPEDAKLVMAHVHIVG
jgi:hypothetical protein